MNRIDYSIVIVVVVDVEAEGFLFPTLSADIILSSLAFWSFVSSHLFFLLIEPNETVRVDIFGSWFCHCEIAHDPEARQPIFVLQKRWDIL